MNYEYPTKECNECKKELPIYEFGYSPSRDYHFPKCKECTKKKRKPWYTKPKFSNRHHVWRKSGKAMQKEKEVKKWETDEEKFDKWWKYG